MERANGFAKGASERGAGSRRLTEGFTRSVDGQTPPVSLTLNHLPFQAMSSTKAILVSLQIVWVSHGFVFFNALGRAIWADGDYGLCETGCHFRIQAFSLDSGRS